MKLNQIKIVVFAISALFFATCTVVAQSQKRVIQLSGVVLGSDSTNGVPGVHVYVPKAGRGTTTNTYGFFSMPVLVGDSVVASAVGYERQYFIVPNHSTEYMTIVFEMMEDVTYLREVLITPFPTEEVFKEAVLALNVPVERGIDQKNIDAELLALLVKVTPMDGYQNSRNYLNQWSGSQNDKFVPIVNPLLNPFNWARFIQSLKKNKK